MHLTNILMFAEDGKWLSTESDLENEDLPEVIKSSLSKQFDGYALIDSELIDSADNGRLYKVHLERGEELLLVTLDESGNVVKREKDDDEG